MNIPNLTQEEIELLQNHLKSSPIELTRLKSQAVLMLDDKLNQELIAKYVGKGVRTIQRWNKEFQEIRIASIFSRKLDNENSSKLTREQKEEISKVLQSPPSLTTLPKEFWDVPSLRDYVAETFGVVYESRQSYHFLLKYSNLSFKYPDRFDIRRDEEVVKERMSNIRKEIQEYLNSPDWEVFSSDETRIVSESEVHKAWLVKGKKTIVKVDRTKDFQNYIGFLDHKSYKFTLYELSWQTQDEILNALKKLLKKYPDKRICIVWDNAAFHRGKKIQEALKSGNLLERVHLIPLPPYAPDKNPVEHVWQWSKGQRFKLPYESFSSLKSQFRRLTQSRVFEYNI